MICIGIPSQGTTSKPDLPCQSTQQLRRLYQGLSNFLGAKTPTTMRGAPQGTSHSAAGEDRPLDRSGEKSDGFRQIDAMRFASVRWRFQRQLSPAGRSVVRDAALRGCSQATGLESDANFRRSKRCGSPYASVGSRAESIGCARSFRYGHALPDLRFVATARRTSE